MTTVNQAVANFYEAFAYPHYPLLARARWQEAFAASPQFAASIARTSHQTEGNILVAGSGEMLPSLIDRWKPRRQKMTCVDLSRRSLWRAQARLLRQGSWAKCIASDLEVFLRSDPTVYQHIDAYGVLHHMEHPERAINSLAARLADGGTMRLMVYNSHARGFITRLQQALQILGTDPHNKRDRDWVAALLEDWQLDCPHLHTRLQQIGGSTLTNSARFVDTFMHPREHVLSYDAWLDAIADAGLTVCGLFDRYGELDDLAPTLWQMPKREEMRSRIADLRFENNFEFYLRKGPPSSKPSERRYPLRPSIPPRFWWSFRETRSLSFLKRQAVWSHFCKGDSLPDMPTQAGARLLRLGVIHPDSLPSGKCQRWQQPLCKAMQPPNYPAPTPLAHTRVPQMFHAYHRDPQTAESALEALTS